MQMSIHPTLIHDAFANPMKIGHNLKTILRNGMVKNVLSGHCQGKNFLTGISQTTTPLKKSLLNKLVASPFCHSCKNGNKSADLHKSALFFGRAQ